MKFNLAPPVVTDAVVPMVWLLKCGQPVGTESEIKWFATTAASLSNSTHTGFPVQRWPQAATAKTIEMRSLIDMWVSVSMPALKYSTIPRSWHVWSEHKLWGFQNQSPAWILNSRDQQTETTILHPTAPLHWAESYGLARKTWTQDQWVSAPKDLAFFHNFARVSQEPM